MTLAKSQKFFLLALVLIFATICDYSAGRIAELKQELELYQGTRGRLLAVEERLRMLENIAIRKDIPSSTTTLQRFVSNQQDGGLSIKTISNVGSLDGETVKFKAEAPSDSPREKSEYFEVGRGAKGEHYRILIDPTAVLNQLPPQATVIGATLYLKRIREFSQGRKLLDVKLNAYQVLKKWEKDGGVSWSEAIPGEVKWAEPGCGKPFVDFDPNVLATSGPTVESDFNGWVALPFVTFGNAFLTQWINGHQQVLAGILIRTEESDSPDNRLRFHSSTAANPADRPYLEIFYAL